MYVVHYKKDVLEKDLNDLYSRFINSKYTTFKDLEKYMDYKGKINEYFSKKQWVMATGDSLSNISEFMNELYKDMFALKQLFDLEKTIKEIIVIFPYNSETLNINILSSLNVSHITDVQLIVFNNNRVKMFIYGVETELEDNPNYFNDYLKYEKISKFVESNMNITNGVMFTMIFDINNLYQFNKINKYMNRKFKLNYYNDIYMEAIGNKIFTSIIDNKIFTSIIDNNFDESQKYLDKHKHEIWTLVNYINYTFREISLHPTIHKRINDFLDWYDEKGREQYKIRMYKNTLYYDLDLDNDEYVDEVREYLSTPKYEIYEYDENGNIINNYYIDYFTKLVKQLYYTLALIITDKIDENGMPEKLNEVERKAVLHYLEKAGDYKNSKELLKKLFNEYIGLSFGEELDVDVTDPSILTLYKFAKLMKK